MTKIQRLIIGISMVGAALSSFWFAVEGASPVGGFAGENIPVAHLTDAQLFLPQSLHRGQSATMDKIPSPPVAAIGPHHLPYTGQMLTDLYATILRSRPEINGIILLAPDHQNTFPDGLITGCLTFSTSRGKTECAKDLTHELITLGLAREDTDRVTSEHALFSHLPALQSYFPNVKMTPILFGHHVTPERTRELVRWLERRVGAQTFVVASLDLSHYLPLAEARVQDASTIPALLSMEAREQALYLDSIRAVEVLFDFLTQRGVSGGALLQQGNSAELGGDQSVTTSYATILY